ncbi:swr1 complex component, partial [Aspergillus fumigatus]
MQDGSLNGLSHHNDERVNHENEDKSLNTSALGDSPDSANRELIPSESKENGVPTDSIEGPPSKRRKLAGPDNSRRSTPRPPSPPWKKAGVDGPTSFLQDGKRRSSRVNAIPLELQPPSDKRKTRAAQRSTVNKNLSGNGKVVASSPLSMSVSQSGINGTHTGGNLTTGSPRTATPRGASARRRRISRSPPRQTPSRTRSQSSATSAPNDPTSHNARSKRSHSNVTSTPTIGIDELWNDIRGETDLGDEHGQRVPRLRIKVKKPVIGFQHPSHVIPPRKYNSFREWLESGEGRIEDGAVLTPEAALVEARKRCRVLEATEPGGLLSPEVCSAYLPEQQEEPPQQYSHQDHLVAHALYFKKLLDQEHRRHRNTARLLAQWCADAWRKRNKRPEDILREQQEEVRVKRKQLAKDLQKMFDLARAEVDRMRLARWEEERKVEDQRALDRAIKQSTMLFEKRRLEILGETGSDFLDSPDAEESGTDATTSDAEEDESNMSSTDPETEDEDE